MTFRGLSQPPYKTIRKAQQKAVLRRAAVFLRYVVIGQLPQGFENDDFVLSANIEQLLPEFFRRYPALFGQDYGVLFGVVLRGGGFYTGSQRVFDRLQNGKQDTEAKRQVLAGVGYRSKGGGTGQ